MITHIFAIKDKVAEAFNNPFYQHTKPAAVRAFGDAIKDPSSPFAKHPEDYALYHLGSYDDSTGIILAAEPEIISRASDHISQ